MFTGIVTDIGIVHEITADGDTHFQISTAHDTDSIAIGASIACAGVCLTVVDKAPPKDNEPGWFQVTASAETMSLTTLSDWKAGDRVNLERSLKVGDELGGHIVSGHVDGIGVVEERQVSGDSVIFSITAPQAIAPFIAPKGSIAIDGVSITVNRVDGNKFTVNIIPHTQSVTTLGDLNPGAKVNLEIDTLARYVARLVESQKG